MYIVLFCFFIAVWFSCGFFFLKKFKKWFGDGDGWGGEDGLMCWAYLAGFVIALFVAGTVYRLLET